MQALTRRNVDLAFRVYQALLGAAAGGYETQPMDTDAQVRNRMFAASVLYARASFWQRLEMGPGCWVLAV